MLTDFFSAKQVRCLVTLLVKMEEPAEPTCTHLDLDCASVAPAIWESCVRVCELCCAGVCRGGGVCVCVCVCVCVSKKDER